MMLSDHIKHSLDCADRKDMEQAMLHACIAVDGTAKKTYPNISKAAKRFKTFINDNIDIIELMFGGINLEETVFPFLDKKGKKSMTFADIVYEKFRCYLAHGEELLDGYGILVQIAEGHQRIFIDLNNQSIMLPQSVIYALGFPCVLAAANSGQMIGSNLYYYRASKHTFVVDEWWGKVNEAKNIMDLNSRLRVRLNL